MQVKRYPEEREAKPFQRVLLRYNLRQLGVKRLLASSSWLLEKPNIKTFWGLPGKLRNTATTLVFIGGGTKKSRQQLRNIRNKVGNAETVFLWLRVKTSGKTEKRLPKLPKSPELPKLKGKSKSLSR